MKNTTGLRAQGREASIESYSGRACVKDECSFPFLRIFFMFGLFFNDAKIPVVLVFLVAGASLAVRFFKRAFVRRVLIIRTTRESGGWAPMDAGQ